jgi:hypothetical protein
MNIVLSFVVVLLLVCFVSTSGSGEEYVNVLYSSDANGQTDRQTHDFGLVGWDSYLENVK